ncbi:MAG: universal stress protein [Actinomycetota bacterium]|nr:universal stress protein [Actinomycetota bacterium]
MYERIVVGTDLSRTARVATDRAAHLAPRIEAELVLVYAGDDPSGDVEALAKEYGGRAIVQRGNPADVLLDHAQGKDDLLVVGSVGMSGPRRLMLGNIPNKVSHHAETDLLIVKSDDPSRARNDDYKKVLVGTDGSPTAMRAVEAGVGFSDAVGAEITIVTAYQPPTHDELARMKASPDDPYAQWDAPREDETTPQEFRWRIPGAAQAQDVLERAADRASGLGVKAEIRSVEGHAAEQLLSIAENEDFDVIIVGSVGMTGHKRFMLGNVPHHVSHHSPIDVLILRTA